MFAGSVLVRVGSADRYEGMKLFMTAVPTSTVGAWLFSDKPAIFRFSRH